MLQSSHAQFGDTIGLVVSFLDVLNLNKFRRLSCSKISAAFNEFVFVTRARCGSCIKTCFSPSSGEFALSVRCKAALEGGIATLCSNDGILTACSTFESTVVLDGIVVPFEDVGIF